jgi:hypothetical protein
MAYTYQADVWCDKCGEAIRAEITAEGKAPADPEDEGSYDSGEFPKYYNAENEESDSPENCADGHCDGDHGTFLQNGLTSEGYKHLKSMLDAHGETLPPHAQEWADHYGFTFFKNEYETAHEWLEQAISRLAEKTTGDGAAELVSMARELARQLDGDAIQDLYQSDMDSDDYFKETGWYSDEMEAE